MISPTGLTDEAMHPIPSRRTSDTPHRSLDTDEPGRFCQYGSLPLNRIKHLHHGQQAPLFGIAVPELSGFHLLVIL